MCVILYMYVLVCTYVIALACLRVLVNVRVVPHLIGYQQQPLHIDTLSFISLQNCQWIK